METEQIKEKKVFMKPGRTNKEDRLNFIEFWADYVRTHSDEEWSEQQNVLINSVVGIDEGNGKVKKVGFIK